MPEAGAYTGANKAREGRFENADGGTLFLDEIGNLPLSGQMKLLRVLETGQFERLGSGRTRTVKVRVLSATNADLPAMIREGRFREDLYYRLNVIELALPPLKDRPTTSCRWPRPSSTALPCSRTRRARPPGAHLAGQRARTEERHRACACCAATAWCSRPTSASWRCVPAARERRGRPRGHRGGPGQGARRDQPGGGRAGPVAPGAVPASGEARPLGRGRGRALKRRRRTRPPIWHAARGPAA